MANKENSINPPPTPSRIGDSEDEQRSTSPRTSIVDEDQEGSSGFGENGRIDGRRERSGASETEANRKPAKRLHLDLVDDDEDRISALDDALLIHILSLLRTEDAIKTGILSKRWANLWTCIPKLRFRYESRSGKNLKTVTQFVSFVEATLNLHKSPKLFDFQICWESSIEIDDYDENHHDDNGVLRLDSHKLDLWIRFATRANVEMLILSLYDKVISLAPNHTLPQYVFDCSSLTGMFLSHFDITPKGIVNWKLLKCLSIGYTMLTNDAIEKLLLGSPVLEDLDLYRCGGLNRLEITSTSLRKLMIEDYWNWEESNGDNWLEIVAPNLKVLELCGRFEKKCRLVNASSLVSVSFCMEIPKEVEDEDEDEDEDFNFDFGIVNFAMVIPNEDEDVNGNGDGDGDEDGDGDGGDGDEDDDDLYANPELLRMVEELIHRIRHVKELILGVWFHVVYSLLLRTRLMSLPPLSMCKSLLITILRTRKLGGIDCMLRTSPHLEMLTIEFVPLIHTAEYDGKKRWTSRVKTLECLQLHLKTVKIVGCIKCDKCDIETLAQFFLEKAMVLKTLEIKICRCNRSYPSIIDKGELAEELLKFPRSSPHAVVMFS